MVDIDEIFFSFIFGIVMVMILVIWMSSCCLTDWPTVVIMVQSVAKRIICLCVLRGMVCVISRKAIFTFFMIH